MNEILNFWKDLLIKPKDFFRKEFIGNTKIRFFNIAIAVFCIGYGIDKANKQLIKFDLRGNLDTINFLNNWIGFWAFAIIGGAIGGYILYLIGGWFYDIRLKWSNGTSNLEQSRNLYLYSNFFLYLTIVLTGVQETIINQKPYDTLEVFNLFDFISIVLLLFFIFHSIYISFIGVTTVTDVDIKKARIWFALLPIVFYLFIFGALVMLLVNYIV